MGIFTALTPVVPTFWRPALDPVPQLPETLVASNATEMRRGQKIADLRAEFDEAKKTFEYYSTYAGKDYLSAYLMRYFAIDEGDDIAKQLALLGVKTVPIASEPAYAHILMQDKRAVKGQIATFAFSFHILGHFLTWSIKLFVNPLTPPKQVHYVA